LFEPGKYLPMNLTGVEPVMVPTPHAELLSTPYGLLLSELYRSPDTVISSVLVLLKGAIACDTGLPSDYIWSNDFNTSTLIILYVTRLAARVDSYISFLINWATECHDCVDWPLREVYFADDILEKLVINSENSP